jgi:hypothetical protein
VKQHGVGSPHRHCFHSPLRASSSCIPRHSLINHLNAYLASLLLEPAGENLEEKYERFFQQSGLFVERLAEEEQRYQAISEERLKELAAKLGAAGPLSEVIVAERGGS